jgi:hypothetical protein
MYTGPNISDNGLVLCLDAANVKSYVSGSTVWNDLSGNKNSGSLVNGPSFDSSNLGSIVFDGSNDIVNLGNPNSLNISNSLTLSSWIKMNSWLNYPGILTKGYDLTGGYSIHIRDDYSIWFEIFLSTDVRQNHNPKNIKISLNSWFNIVCTYDQTKMQIYINGKAVDDGKLMSGLIKVTSSDVILGSLPSYGFFNGSMSNVQIYNRALSQEEILQNYEGLRSRYGL